MKYIISASTRAPIGRESLLFDRRAARRAHRETRRFSKIHGSLGRKPCFFVRRALFRVQKRAFSWDCPYQDEFSFSPSRSKNHRKTPFSGFWPSFRLIFYRVFAFGVAENPISTGTNVVLEAIFALFKSLFSHENPGGNAIFGASQTVFERHFSRRARTKRCK